MSVPGTALSLPERMYTRSDDDNDVSDAMHKHVEGESSKYKKLMKRTVE
jgi:hypothetical protein